VKYCYHYIDFQTFVPYINDIMIACAYQTEGYAISLNIVGILNWVWYWK